MIDINNIDIFPWNKSLETGIKIIDQQHKILVGLINKVAQNVAYGTTQQEFEDNVEEVIKYTKYHFQTEEEIWKKYFHTESALNTHILAHTRLVDSVTTIVTKFETQTLEQNIEDLLSTLTHWLTHHILDSDMRMALTVNAIDSGNSLENAHELADKKMKGVMSVIIETSLFLYDNLCANTLAYNREINLQKKIESDLRNKIRTHEHVNKKTSVVNKHKLSELPENQLIKEFSNALGSYTDNNNSGKAILFIAINGVIDIIESGGQAVADEFLINLTDDIKTILNTSELLIRLSYNNFAIFYDNSTNKSQLEAYATQIMAFLSATVTLNNNLKPINADIDIVIYPEDTCIEDELLMKSTNAIYSTFSSKYEFSSFVNEDKLETEIKLKKLTPREFDVLELVVNGNTNKFIAKELEISIKTVELHRSRVMKKMEVKTLADLVKITLS